MRAASAPVVAAMLATLHRAPILAAVGLFAATLVRMPRDAPAVAPAPAPAAPAGCPVPVIIALPPPVVAPAAHLIYISGPDDTGNEPARY